MAIHRSLPLFLALALTLCLCLGSRAWAEDQDATDAGNDTASGSPAEDTAVTPPPPPKNPPLPLDLQKGQRLAQEFAQQEDNKTSLEWFRQGQKDAFLGLYSEHYGREPQGYALILHDNQQHPDWPGLVHYLRTQLPAKGWSTLAISLPDRWQLTAAPPRDNDQVIVQPAATDGSGADAPTPPASDTSADSSQDDNATTSNTSPAEPTQDGESGISGNPASELTYTQLSVEYAADEVPDIIQQRVTEALGFLQGLDPMPIIVIGMGSSATIVAKQVHTLRMKDIAGLVIVDPARLAEGNFKVEEDAAGLRIPVLDLVPQFNPQADPSARLRSARRSGTQFYEQQIIPGADSSFTAYEEFATKAIRGWARRKITDKSRFGYL